MGKVYPIIMVKEVHASELKGCETHNRRLYTPDRMPANINPEKTPYNYEWIVDEKPGFKEAIDERIKGLKVRKNSVIALEFVMSASKEFYEGNYQASGYLSQCETFLGRRYGWENVISANQHFDEDNPHVHVLVLPIKEKTVKWKNRRGQGQKTERRLCARDFTGNREMLRQLQDDFYQYVKIYGEVAGVPFSRGVPGDEQTRVYAERTNYLMAEINRKAEQAQREVDAAQRLELQNQIVQDKKELDKTLQTKNEAEKRAAYKKKKNKGLDFPRGY
jgi:Plasmid recombination enzyme